MNIASQIKLMLDGADNICGGCKVNMYSSHGMPKFEVLSKYKLLVKGKVRKINFKLIYSINTLGDIKFNKIVIPNDQVKNHQKRTSIIEDIKNAINESNRL